MTMKKRAVIVRIAPFLLQQPVPKDGQNAPNAAPDILSKRKSRGRRSVVQFGPQLTERLSQPSQFCHQLVTLNAKLPLEMIL